MPLIVWTARIDYGGADRFDVTRKGAAEARLAGRPAPGAPFAPPKWLWDVVRARPGAAGRLPSQVRHPAEGEDVHGGSAWYAEAYTYAMRESYRLHKAAWVDLLSRAEVTLVCYCVDPTRCHRTLLAGFLRRCGAILAGERARPYPRPKASDAQLPLL
jgi:hypothetical protein